VKQVWDEFVVALEIQIANVKENNAVARFAPLPQNLNRTLVPFQQRSQVFRNNRELHHFAQRCVRQMTDDLRRHAVFRRRFDHQRQLRRGLLQFHGRLRCRKLRAVDNVAPMNQVPQGSGLEPKLLSRGVGNQHGARLIVWFIKHMRARILLEVLRIGGSQKRALVMVEPPGHLRRIRVFEVDDYVLVAVKQIPFPRLGGPMGHSREMKFGARVNPLAIEAVKKCGGSGAIKTAVMKAQSYFSHRREVRAFRVIRSLLPPPAKLFKMLAAERKVKSRLQRQKKKPPD
jgi:hypothetical protein